MQLTDRDAHAICAKIAQTQYPTAVRDADEPDVLSRPVFQDVLYLAAAGDRKIHATRLAVDVAKLETCLTDCRIVHDRQKARRIRHDGPVKERFVVIEQIDEVDVAIEVSVLLAELQHHAAQLQILGLGDVRHQANEAERLLLVLGKRRRFVER